MEIEQSESGDPYLKSTLKGYKLTDKLCGGTYGMAYLAHPVDDPSLHCVVKIQNDLPYEHLCLANKQTKREIDFLSKHSLNHPFIVRCIDAFPLPGDPWR
jgi:serine/threonine protein kinase